MSTRRRNIKLFAGASVVIVASALVLTYSFVAGWWSGGLDSSKVYITDFYYDVSGVSECTAVLRYVIHNDNSLSAAAQIKYYDNGIEVASDFYILGANRFRHVTYYIEYVDCQASHNYEAVIVAIS